jgi:hypothetical protein
MKIVSFEYLLVLNIPAADFGYVIKCVFELSGPVMAFSVVLIKKNRNTED